MGKNIMNVLFSSDDKYAQHLGVAIYSLLEHNTAFNKITIYIVDNDISDINKQKLNKTADEFDNAEIIFLPFNKWKNKLHLNMKWDISISSYARLFIADMLPDDIDQVLYMDCDVIICESLENLWNTDLNNNVLGAVQDTVNDKTKGAVGLLPEDKYFNAGILLIDLKKWRKQNIGIKCLKFIEEKNGSVTHHDQGTLNGVLNGKWYRLPLKYNLMTIHYIFNYRKNKKYFKDHSNFYLYDDIENAKLHPAILHYVPSFTTRPWVSNCKHPKKNLYWNIISKTPWIDAKPEKDKSKWYVKLINFRYRKLYW